MIRKLRANLCIATVLLALLPALATAQQISDATLSYFARHNSGDFDNDIIRGALGVTWETPDGGTRAALALGVRNEFFDGDYPLDGAVEALRFRRTGFGLVGAGGRVLAVEGRGMAGELALAGEVHGPWWTGRALAGLQALSDDDPRSGDTLGGYGVAEGTVYPARWLALRAGGAVDGSDLLGTLGAEIAPYDGPVSLWAEWVVGPKGFRGGNKDDGFLSGLYNDFVFGVRVTHRFGGLKERDRAVPLRLLQRPVDPL